MAKSKRYDEGGVTEGQNTGIDDDTRARAMKYVQDQADSADMEEPAVEAKPSARAVKAAKVAKAEAKAEAKADARDAETGRSRGIRGDGEPKTTMGASRTRTREEVQAAIPTGGKKGAGPTPGNGNSVEGTETSRNIKNTLMAMGPTRLAGLGNAAAEGAMTARAAGQAAKAAEAAKATRAARTAKVAPRAAREAKTLNPNAWMAGPKGMKENFKSGGMTASSRADGVATKGKTRCRIC